MSDTHNTSTVNPTPYIYSDTWLHDYRNLFIDNMTSSMGEPKTLQGGSYYYMELYHCNTGGKGGVKIRVEIPNSDASLKWQRYEVNHIETSYTNDPEIIEFVLSNVDTSVGSNFNISLTRTNTATLKTTVQLSSFSLGDSASTFAGKIDNIDILKGYTVSGISAEAFDVNGNVVASSSLDAVTFKWTISVFYNRTESHFDETSSLKYSSSAMNGGVTLAINILHKHGP